MCSNTRLISLHFGLSSYFFNNVYMTEQITENTTATGNIQKKHFILYIFRNNSDVPLEDIDWDAFKSESYVVDEDNPAKKYHIINYKKCLYGSYGMHHIEMEME